MDQSGSGCEVGAECSSSANSVLATDNNNRDSVSQNGQTQLFLTLLPFTTQQLLMQTMITNAAAAVASQQQHIQQQNKQQIGNQLRPEESESSSSSLNAKSISPPGAPMNLTKGNNIDTESIDRNLSDQSANPSFTDENSSSNQNTPTEGEQALQFALSKLVGLIEVATTNFKAQRDIIDNEKTFAQKLQTELDALRKSEERMKHKLAQEERKSRTYFRRFCRARQESLDLQSRLAQMNERKRLQSI